MGGKSSSSNASTTTNNTQNNNLQGIYGGTTVVGDQKVTRNYNVIDGGAFDVVERSSEVLSDTAKAALLTVQDTAGEAFELSAGAIDSVESSGKYFADKLAEQNTRALEVTNDTVVAALNRTAQQSDAALSFANNATKADGGQSETIIKYALGASVLVVVASQFSRN